MKSFFLASICVSAALGPLLHAQQRDGSLHRFSLSELSMAVDRHPELEMGRAGLEADRARIPMRSSLMDPELILGVQNLPTSLSFHEEPMTSKVVGIGQSFSFPGKLSKERTIGEIGVEIDSFMVEEKRNMLRRETKLAFYDVLHRERSIAAYARHLETLADIEKEVAANAAYAKTPLSAVVRVSLERTEVSRMIAEERSMIAMQFAKLTYISGLTVEDLDAPDSLGMPPMQYSLDSLLNIAEHSRPLLRQIRARTLQANAAIERSQLERYPDFSVMLMYMQRDALATPVGRVSQMDMLSAQLTVKLPFNYNGTKDAAVAESEAIQRMSRSEEDMALREIRMGLSEKLARLEGLRTKHELLRSATLPSLRTIRESLVTDYRFDKTSLQSVIGEELSLLHKQHDLFEIESEAYKTIAEIEFIIGADLIPITR